MKVLVTGAAGQLGHAIVREFQQNAEVVALTRTGLDITDAQAVRQSILDVRPSVIINCAAYNKVDAAESEPIQALEGNAIAVRSLAHAASDVGATLVHYSTDFVFDGEAERPYTETDEPAPRSVYAASKLLGEWFAADAPRWYVLRVESLFGGEQRRSSIDRIVEGMAAGREVPVFTDRTVSPTYVVDAAMATRMLLERNAPGGLYHCVNSGQTTWYELAQEIERLTGRQARLRPVSVSEVRLPAPRPRYCVLSNQKLAAAGVPMPSWQDALRRHLALAER